MPYQAQFGLPGTSGFHNPGHSSSIAWNFDMGIAPLLLEWPVYPSSIFTCVVTLFPHIVDFHTFKPTSVVTM